MSFPFFNRRRGPEIIGSDAPDAWSLGRYCHEETGHIGPELRVGGTELIVICGRNRSGKDAGIGMVNGLRMEGSLVGCDPRGEFWAVCGPYRRTLHRCASVNPHGVLTDIPGYEDAESIGWAALGELPNDASLFDHVAGYMDALFPLKAGEDPHWSLRARGVTGGLTMDEVIEADNTGSAGRPRLFANVRDTLTEGDEYDAQTGEPIKGLAATARRLVQQGNPQIASLMGSFTVDNDETRGVRATSDGRTLFMLSHPHRDDELKNGLRLADLATEPMSIFLTMPPDMVQADSMHAPFMRLFFTAALRALYRPTGRITTFYLNEFAALGRLQAVEAAVGLVAGYGIRIVIVVQSLTQLRQLYDHAWENFLGNAAALALVGPPADKFTAEYLSARSGETTIIQPNVGMNLNPAGGIGLSNGEAYTRRRVLMPQDLYSLQNGYGYVWMAGLSNAIPVYYPPYFDIELLARRARKNPYYRG